uniref:Uncharacterized protein n=1 Tax=Takifugu rubripes TaxID=31033 RepID=A0A674N5U0_TAKRU
IYLLSISSILFFYHYRGSFFTTARIIQPVIIQQFATSSVCFSSLARHQTVDLDTLNIPADGLLPFLRSQNDPLHLSFLDPKTINKMKGNIAASFLCLQRHNFCHEC